MISFSNVSPDIAQAMCTPMHLILPAGSSSPSSPTTRNSSRPALSSSHSQSCTQPPGYGALWLGSVSAVLDSSHLREVNIRHLVQVLDVPWLPPLEKEGYETYRMDILDLESENLRPHLEDVVEDIDKALRRGKNVLVHCQQVGLLHFQSPHTHSSRPNHLVLFSSCSGLPQSLRCIRFSRSTHINVTLAPFAAPCCATIPRCRRFPSFLSFRFA